MKGKSLLVWVVLTLLIALMMAPGSTMAQADRAEFAGTEVPVGLLDEGIWVFLPSGNVHVRGMTTLYQEMASDPRMSGLNTVVMNANWSPYFSGPMWGTSESVISDSADCPGGGFWRGTWTGTMNADGSYSYRAIGKGLSGCVEGLLYTLIATNPGGGELTTYTGEILDPKGE